MLSTPDPGPGMQDPRFAGLDRCTTCCAWLWGPSLRRKDSLASPKRTTHHQLQQLRGDTTLVVVKLLVELLPKIAPPRANFQSDFGHQMATARAASHKIEA